LKEKAELGSLVILRPLAVAPTINRLSSLIIICLLRSAAPSSGQTGIPTSAPQIPKKQELVYMEVWARGQINWFGKVLVVGTVKLEDEGFRFTPVTYVPEDFMSQKAFEREFWYNTMFNDLYISYASIKKMKYNASIKLKDRRKYKLYSRSEAYWGQVHNSIASKITKD
jgi:hypothetical protein